VGFTPFPSRRATIARSPLLLTLLFSSSLHLLIYLFFPPVPRHLPDQALISELTIKFWIDAHAAMVDIETLTALLTKAGFMFLTDGNGLSIGVDSALHLMLLYHLSRLFFCLTFKRFETGRCLKST